MKISVYNLSGDKSKEIELSSRIFGVAIKPEVVHQVVVAQQANSREVLADTKGRGEVRGGGKKPWKQKGTGRARHGSTRSPIWVKGGITFGPTSARNFSLKVNKKQKQLALSMCLTDKVANDAMVVFEDLKLANAKTKELNTWIKDIKAKIAELKDCKKLLLVLGGNDQDMIKAAANLANVNTISADSLNCVEVLKYDRILTSEKAIEQINKHYKLIRAKAATENKK